MVKVTKEQFYKAIGPHDICVTSRGFDHSRFETRTRVEVGRAYDAKDETGETVYDDSGRPVRNYFLTNEFWGQHGQGN